jgi:hypothetical protein
MPRVERFDPFLGWVTVSTTARPARRLAALRRLFPADRFRLVAAR